MSSKKSKMLLALVIGISVPILLYLTGAFIAWDFNARNWPDEGRAIVGFFSLFGVAGSVFGAVISNMDT